MTSMGEIYSDIEWMVRLLEQNRLETREIIKRQHTLKGRPGSSIKENETLKKRFHTLIRREDEIQRDLEQLIIFVLMHRIREIRSSHRDSFNDE